MKEEERGRWLEMGRAGWQKLTRGGDKDCHFGDGAGATYRVNLFIINNL